MAHLVSTIQCKPYRVSIYAKHPTEFSEVIRVCSQKWKCGSYSITLSMCLRLHRAQNAVALQSAGWGLRGRQAASSELEQRLRAVPSSLTSTYKLFILPLHAVAIDFLVPTSAKYDCSAYLPISQEGSKAHLQLTSYAKGWSTSFVLIIVMSLSFDCFPFTWI